MSKASNNSEHSWFESETLRYWKYVSVFGILLVNVINEIINPSIDFEMHYSSLSAILVFCSAFWIFVIFVLQKDARNVIFKKSGVVHERFNQLTEQNI
ncbi:CLUMA_CG008059, isoform A [Clunio marinus]|uniref:CLUMA_CG008059, isoform A n=1 Tax=Clunio marinus TaxID=568069 RepID=A0A1J1I2Q1_9DIPT|nr:CLUMA_CG008059, isoform A [Clunio marinus]